MALQLECLTEQRGTKLLKKRVGNSIKKPLKLQKKKKKIKDSLCNSGEITVKLKQGKKAVSKPLRTCFKNFSFLHLSHYTELQKWTC